MKYLGSVLAFAALYTGLVSARALPGQDGLQVGHGHNIGEILTRIYDLSNICRYC